MRRLSTIVAVAISTLALGLPTIASGARPRCASAPGTSAIDQYCESIPGATGGAPTSGPQGSDIADVQRVLPPGAAAKISGTAPSDRGLASLVAHGPRATSDTARIGRAGDSDRPLDAGSAPSDNPVSAIASSVSDGPTVGPALVIAMLCVALVAGGILWLGHGGRRRS